MLFMVIEHFINSDPTPIGERFQPTGRQMPEGLIYHASWVKPRKPGTDWTGPHGGVV
jgi:hypothetical protein